MKKYDGFRVRCGCHCSKCGGSLILEGYSDANGNHYCPSCDDYVSPIGNVCNERTPEKINRREKVIIDVGALED